VGEGPVMATGASELLRGERPTVALIEDATRHTATVDLDPPGDIHASARYRRHLAQVLGRRALVEAFGRAGVVVE
jgi:CO/xanthine dehydrogenase FAD-binding subunit